MENDKKSLLIIPKYNNTYEKDYKYFFPIGLGCILAVLKNNGFNVDCLNLNHKIGTADDIIKDIKTEYEYVLTGGLAVDFSPLKDIFNAVRKYTSSKIILGGMIITTEPEVIFNEFKPDIGIIGEGEEIIIDIFKEKPLKDIKGILFIENGEMVFTGKRQPSININNMPIPAFEDMGYEEYLDNQRPSLDYRTSWIDSPRIYSLLGSRGCPYNCTFCYHYDKYRERSLEDVFKEIDAVIDKYNINVINFMDECFVNRKRITEFCNKFKKLVEEKKRLIVWACSLRVDIVDDDLMKMLKESHCTLINYGLESYSKEVLDSMKKCITPEQIDKALKITFKYKIPIQANFIFGDPVETLETADETLKYWKNNCKGQITLDFIRPFPNSVVYQHCLKKGIIKDKIKFIKNLNINYDSENMTNLSDKDFKKLKYKVLKYLSKYRTSTSYKSINKMKEGIYTISSKCPFCGEIHNYKNMEIKNELLFGFYVICPHCWMKYYLCSPLQRFFYKRYGLFYDLKRVIKR